MNAIEISHLNKTYPGFSLEDITLSLPRGSILGLVGENGAGKSTLIKLMMNATIRDSGRVHILGIDTQSMDFNEGKEDIGIVLDEACFPELLTAKELGAVMGHTYRNWDPLLYRTYLQDLSLPADKAFKDLSRGMKMKLAISVALSHHPKLLILDEATSGLDPMIRNEILDMFHDFTRDETQSILLSSHIISDLEKICDYIAFLHKGKLLFCEEKDKLREEFVLLRLSHDDFKALPPEAIKGIRQNHYDVEALVLRSAVSSAFPPEHTTLEDIILFLSKGGQKQ